MDPVIPSESAMPQPLPRRRFITLAGGGAVAAAMPLAGCASGYPDGATRAWRTADQETDLRRHMLAHGLLAPNPHNRQPWIADLREPDRISLHCDGERLLPETDPFGRQILIGCGAFLELALIAAAERGVAVDLQRFPDGAPDGERLPPGHRVAVLRLRGPGSARPDPLFAQIPRRHTAKSVYAAERALPDGLAERWIRTARDFGLTAGVISDAPGMNRLRAITREAHEIESLTPRTWLESARLMRIGPAEIERHRDGISLNATMPRLLHALGLFDPMEVPRPGSSALQRVRDRWAAFETGSGYLWLSSRGNTREAQLDAGRAYVRMHLQATEAGVAMHPLSQALQEFPEMQGPRAAAHAALGLAPGTHTLQMLARTGFAAAPPAPSPRRDLAALLRA
jgi:hypothetical protein